MFFTIYWFSLFHFCTANLCKQHLPLISGGWPGQHDALSVCTVTYAYQHKGGPLSSCSGLTSNPQQFLSCELSSRLNLQPRFKSWLKTTLLSRLLFLYWPTGRYHDAHSESMHVMVNCWLGIYSQRFAWVLSSCINPPRLTYWPEHSGI